MQARCRRRDRDARRAAGFLGRPRGVPPRRTDGRSVVADRRRRLAAGAAPMSRAREHHSGGMPARRATVRWARRLVRRGWRQHLLIVSIISVALAATILLSTAAYNVAPAQGRAEFGDADTALPLD